VLARGWLPEGPERQHKELKSAIKGFSRAEGTGLGRIWYSGRKPSSVAVSLGKLPSCRLPAEHRNADGACEVSCGGESPMISS